MGRLGPLSGQDVVAVLLRNGFDMRTGKGDHVVMQAVRDGRTFTAVVPLHRELAKGTLAGIVRQSGLDRSAFTD